MTDEVMREAIARGEARMVARTQEKAHLELLEAVADAARRLTTGEVLTEQDVDALHDAVFALDREEQAWAG